MVQGVQIAGKILHKKFAMIEMGPHTTAIAMCECQLSNRVLYDRVLKMKNISKLPPFLIMNKELQDQKIHYNYYYTG